MVGHGFPKPRAAGSSPGAPAIPLLQRVSSSALLGHFLNSPFCDQFVTILVIPGANKKSRHITSSTRLSSAEIWPKVLKANSFFRP